MTMNKKRTEDNFSIRSLIFIRNHRQILYCSSFRSACYLIIRYPALTVSRKIVETLTFVHIIGIVTETELIKVSLHMLAAYPTVSTVYGTFAIVAPKRFNGIGICATVNIDTVAVVNDMMVI
mgnify:CR=1 FL=1